jgi:hypothetical protein
VIVCRGCPVRSDCPSRRFDATFPRTAAMKISIAESSQARSHFHKITGSGQIRHPGYRVCRARVITAAMFSTVCASNPASQVIPARPLGVGQRYAVQRQGTPATPR